MQTTTRRALAAALVAVAAFGTTRTDAADNQTTTHCRVLGSGDSILDRVAPFFPDDWCIDTERGRDPYTPGHDNQSDSYDMLMSQVDDVPRGGWLVIQDYNHIGSTTAAQWFTMLHDVVAALPNGRCVLGIAPYLAPSGYPLADYDRWLDSKLRWQVMVDELVKQGCFEIISLNQVVVLHPEYIEDGVHPTSAGVGYIFDRMVDIMGR